MKNSGATRGLILCNEDVVGRCIGELKRGIVEFLPPAALLGKPVIKCNRVSDKEKPPTGAGAGFLPCFRGAYPEKLLL